jgi:tetratricopeptide (TPR) repeat protein
MASFQKFRSRGALCLGTALAVALTGCATQQSNRNNFASTGLPIDPSSPVAQAPLKDRVLVEYETGLSALRRGNYEEAQRMLDDALLTVGGIIGTKDKAARQSRRMFSEESKKTFIGEPYERCMAYFYRGIIYWMNGEPDNARACFRNAEFQDSDTENKEYAGDYVLFNYLDGYITEKYFGGDGSDALKRAEADFKLGKLPPYNKSANAMFFLEFGQGPSKYASGEYSEELRIQQGRSVVKGAWIKVDNKAVRVAPYDDLNFQATTRGGRVMDHILANKAVFKSTTDNFGTAGILSGGILAGTQRGAAQGVGLGLLAAGVLSKIVSSATTPEADTRAWDNLPQYISFAALDLAPGPHTATVEFTDAYGNVIPNLTKTVNFSISAGHDTVVFASDHTS